MGPISTVNTRLFQLRSQVPLIDTDDMDSLGENNTFVHDITGKLYANICNNSFKDNHNSTMIYNTNMDEKYGYKSEIGIEGLNFVVIKVK